MLQASDAEYKKETTQECLRRIRVAAIFGCVSIYVLRCY